MLEKDLLAALGALAPLYADKAIRDIMVDAHNRVLVDGETGTGKMELSEAQVVFESPEALEQAIERVLELAGVQRAGESVFDVRLTGGARMLAIFPPTAPNGPCLVIRKMIIPWVTWEMLIEYGSLTPEMTEVFQSAIRARKNILVAGGTASGKTTFANLLAGLIPTKERLVVVEEVRQFQIEHPRAVFLESGDSQDITWQELLATASKMRPDWLIIGELVGPEALRALEILGHGHSGLATMHAQSVEDALKRLEVLCFKASPGLGLEDIRTTIASAFQLVAYQELLPSGRRKIVQLVELRGLEGGRYVLQPLFRYNPQTDQIEPTGARPSWEMASA